MNVQGVPQKPVSSRSGAKAPRSLGKTLLLNHTRLWIAVAIGLTAFAISPSNWTAVCRVLTAWNCAFLVLLPMTYLWMRRLDAKQLRARYEEEDPTAPVILLVVVVAALLSILAIVALLSNLKHVGSTDRIAHLVLATLTIIDSWLLVPTLFVLHYADEFYSVELQNAPLSFPHTKEPLFWDFVYFSFTISAACQTADVKTNESGVRKAVVAHSIIAFLFNVSILGFAVNVTAGLLN
jgi:uncharacterized membrane protein